MFKTRTKFKNGFTLIELLITLGIMILLMGLTMPFEASYRNKAELKNSTKSLRSLFWEAQNRSLAPRSKDVTAYRISLFKGQGTLSKISLQECKGIDAGMTCIDITGGQTPQVILGKNVTIENILFDGAPIATGIHARTDFAVGDGQGASEISFVQEGTKVNKNKMEVVVVSAAYPSLKYNITVDSKMGSITYGTVVP